MKIFLTTLMVIAFLCTGVSSSFCINSNEALMNQIRRHIEQNISYPPDSVRIEFISALPKMEHLSGKVSCKIESRSNEEYIGDTTFNIRISTNDVLMKEESVRVRIEVLREFIVSQNSIVRGQIVSTDDVTMQKKWVRRIPLNSVSSIDEVVGKTMIVSIRPNTQITRSMLKEIMPVRKGKMVQIILDNGVMRMLTNGVAEEDGAEDSLVKVRNLSSNKIIYARVVGPSRVQVDF